MKKVLLFLICLFAGLGLQAKVNEALNGIRRYSREKNREVSIRRQRRKVERSKRKEKLQECMQSLRKLQKEKDPFKYWETLFDKFF